MAESEGIIDENMEEAQTIPQEFADSMRRQIGATSGDESLSPVRLGEAEWAHAGHRASINRRFDVTAN